MASNSLALSLTIRARESEKRGVLIVRFLLWGDEKIIIYQIKVEGWARKSKQLLLITLPTILVNNNGPGLGKNKSFVNDIQSYKNSQLG